VKLFSSFTGFDELPQVVEHNRILETTEAQTISALTMNDTLVIAKDYCSAVRE
jgi:hypothetical protein